MHIQYKGEGWSLPSQCHKKERENIHMRISPIELSETYFRIDKNRILLEIYLVKAANVIFHMLYTEVCSLDCKRRFHYA